MFGDDYAYFEGPFFLYSFIFNYVHFCLILCAALYAGASRPEEGAGLSGAVHAGSCEPLSAVLHPASGSLRE